MAILAFIPPLRIRRLPDRFGFLDGPARIGNGFLGRRTGHADDKNPLDVATKEALSS
jgi:hypothetical protein